VAPDLPEASSVAFAEPVQALVQVPSRAPLFRASARGRQPVRAQAQVQAQQPALA